MIFDVDRVPVPEHMAGDWVDEPDAAVEHVLSLLPEPFQTATCWWSISSSAASPGAERPGGRQAVQAQAGVLARALCSAPKSSAGWRSRSAGRSRRVRRGAADLSRAAGVRARPARPGAAAQRHLARRDRHRRGARAAARAEPRTDAARTTTFGPVEGLDELCDALRARLAGEAHVREHLLQAARAYVRQHGPDIDQAALVEALEEVAAEHRSSAEVAGYGVDRLVDHVVRQDARQPGCRSGDRRRRACCRPTSARKAPNRFREANRQRLFLKDWLRRNYLCAVARHEIASRSATAFAAAGLA